VQAVKTSREIAEAHFGATIIVGLLHPPRIGICTRLTRTRPAFR
jgi:hypothetical protein